MCGGNASIPWGNSMLGKVNSPRLPVPCMEIVNVTPSFMLTSVWSISTLILNSPTAPLKLLGVGSGNSFTITFTSSD